MALINKLNAIGDAIRAKTGKSDKLSLDDMVTEISAIEGGGGSAIVGGNLFISSEVTNNMYLNNGSETAHNNWAITSYIPMEQGKLYSVAPYTVWGSNLNYSAWYDENKTFIKRVAATDFIQDILVLLSPPEGVKYARFSAPTSAVAATEVYEINTENI